MHLFEGIKSDELLVVVSKIHTSDQLMAAQLDQCCQLRKEGVNV